MFLIYSVSLFAHGPLVAPLQVVTELSPPHQTWEGHRVEGLSTAVVRAVLKEAELDAEIALYPWARAYAMALHSPNVLIYNIARTPEREDLFHWIGPVANYQLGLVRLASRTELSPQSLQDIRSQVVVAQRGDFAVDILTREGLKLGQQLQLSATILESWKLLLSGKVDYVIDDAWASQQMEQDMGLSEGTTKFVLPIQELKLHSYLAASRDTDKKVVERLRAAYQKVEKSQLYQSVIKS